MRKRGVTIPRIVFDKRYAKKGVTEGQIVFITDDDGEIIGGYFEVLYPEVIEDLPEMRLCKVRFPTGIVDYVPSELMGDFLPAGRINRRNRLEG